MEINPVWLNTRVQDTWHYTSRFAISTVKIKSKSVPLHRAGAKRMRRYNSYSLLTSALDGASGQPHAPTALYPRKMTPGTHWIGGWKGLRAGLDTEIRGKIICLCRELKPGLPGCSQTLYWLSYPSSCLTIRHSILPLEDNPPITYWTLWRVIWSKYF
jgi:hypothetical protein